MSNFSKVLEICIFGNAASYLWRHSRYLDTSVVIVSEAWQLLRKHDTEIYSDYKTNAANFFCCFFKRPFTRNPNPIGIYFNFAIITLSTAPKHDLFASLLLQNVGKKMCW